MENLDVMVLRAVRDWRVAGRHVLLATVVHTWGSSPRPVGSIMGLCDDGSVVGSVSGGCIEDDLIHRYTQAGAKKRLRQSTSTEPPAFVKYGVSAEEAHRFGLPCGGTIELLLEYDPNADQLHRLVRDLESGKMMRRRVRLRDGLETVEMASNPEEVCIASGELVNTFGPEYRMLLIGAGQLTGYLATMALFSGFSVTVCDPREEYRGSWNVPGSALVTEMPDDVVTAFRPDRRSCVIALTHDPKLDDLALLEALKSDAFYVGAIGSRANNTARRLRLREHFGLNNTELQRLRGPIGIYIGSKVPSEIAVSVMAEIMAVKNGVTLTSVMAVATAKNLRDAAVSDSGMNLP